MKLSELEKRTLPQLTQDDVIMSIQTITSENGEKIIKKNPVYANSFASKEDVVALSNQNTQLIKLIDALTKKLSTNDTKLKNAEKVIQELTTKLNELETTIANEILTY